MHIVRGSELQQYRDDEPFVDNSVADQSDGLVALHISPKL